MSACYYWSADYLEGNWKSSWMSCHLMTRNCSQSYLCEMHKLPLYWQVIFPSLFLAQIRFNECQLNQVPFGIFPLDTRKLSFPMSIYILLPHCSFWVFVLLLILPRLWLLHNILPPSSWTFSSFFISLSLGWALFQFHHNTFTFFSSFDTPLLVIIWHNIKRQIFWSCEILTSSNVRPNFPWWMLQNLAARGKGRTEQLWSLRN